MKEKEKEKKEKKKGVRVKKKKIQDWPWTVFMEKSGERMDKWVTGLKSSY